jgi:hypothetical protein
MISTVVLLYSKVWKKDELLRAEPQDVLYLPEDVGRRGVSVTGERPSFVSACGLAKLTDRSMT